MSRKTLQARIASAALAVAAGAGAFAMAPAAAHADTTTYSYRNLYLASSNTNGTMFLDVSGGSTAPGAPVIQYWLNGGANQRWNIAQLPNGTNENVNANSGQCLTTDGVAGHGLYQWPCYGGGGQVWSADFTPSASTTHAIKNPASGLKVDIYGNSPWPGAVVDAYYGTGNSNQYFFSFQG